MGQGAQDLFSVRDVTGDTLHAHRFAIPIDQPATKLERKSFSGLGDYLGFINARGIVTFDLAGQVLANDTKLVRRDYLGNVHPERFSSHITSQSLSSLI